LYFQLHVSQSDVLDISGYIPAVDVALRLINSNETILPEYHLMYTEIIDPQCKDTPGVQGLIDHVTNSSRTITEVIIIGADCSISSQPIASLAPLWNLVQISPVSSSPRLSDSAVYSTFLRVVAPDNSIAIGIVQLMKFLEWKYISIITQEEDIFTLTRDALMERVQNSSLTTLSSVSFPSDESPQNALRNLKASSGRIIFLNCYSQYALEILCQALSLGMTYPDYAWITFGWYFDRFWSHPYPDRNYAAFNTCKPAELENIVNHMIFIDHYSRQDDQDSETIIGGLNRSTYEQEYRKQWNKTFGNESHPDQLEDGKFIYDATWLGALALHKTDKDLKEMNPSRGLENFTYGSADIRKLIFKHALATSFNGATGSVKLLPNGDRGPELRFYQYRRQGGALNRSYVGFMDDSQMLTIFTHSQPLYRDGTPKSHIHETIHVALFAAYTVLSVAGAVFAIACLIFNVIFRNKMIVKLSSPYLNIIFIIGILMIYLLVIFLGIDDNLVDIQVMSGFCQATVWIGVIAFTLVYGVVLAKTFKVFYIFKNLQVSKPDQKRTIQDWHMFIFIGCLLAIDILFLIIVTAVPRAILTVMLNEKPLLVRYILCTYTSYCLCKCYFLYSGW
jgi:gamma-aminobutyric acid type B receptor